jgi:hypothetical protein
MRCRVFILQHPKWNSVFVKDVVAIPQGKNRLLNLERQAFRRLPQRSNYVRNISLAAAYKGILAKIGRTDVSNAKWKATCTLHQ